MFFSRSWKLATMKELMLPVLILLLSSGLFLGSASRGIAQDHQDSTRTEIDEINAAIAREGAEWVAGETSLSRLSHAERQSRLGLLPPVITEDEWVIEHFTPMALPSHIDWRDNGGNYVTPIRDQKSCGSCWAFAATAALESATLIALGTPGVDLNLAEQILVSCSGAGSCGGGSPGSASSYIKNTGLPLESCYSYTGTNGNCSNACSNWQASSYKITDYYYVTTSSPTVETLKNALYNYGPLATTMQVYSDFDSYKSGIYSHVTGYLRGGHAILLVGYDDPGQYFICKNSWGTWWGDSGFFKIAYSQINSVVNFGDYTIAYDDAIPPDAAETVSQPRTLSGPTSGTTAASYTYTTGGSSSSEGHSVQYYFDWGDGTNSGWLTAGTASAQKSWSSSGTYAVKARARCSLHPTVISSYTNSLNVVIGCALPGTPSGPSPSNGATGISTSATLSWTACTNATSYDVYLGTSSSPSLVGNTATTTYGVSGLPSGTTYYWKIVAKNTCGGSTPGSVWSFTTVAETITTPSVPSGTVTGSVGSWYTYQTGGSTSSFGHSIQYSFDWGDGTTSGWLPVGTTSASKSWASPGTYSVKAMARCSTHMSTISRWSSAANTAISDVGFTVVKVLSPNGGEIIPAGSTTTVKWGAPSKAVKFRLYYSTNKGRGWKSITADYVRGATYSWTVPVSSSSKKDCLIKVNGYDEYNRLVSYDRSDQPFKIEIVRLNSPNGGTAVAPGGTFRVSWTTHATKNPVAKAKVYFTKDGGTTWKLVDTLEGDPSYYDWWVPNVNSNRCKVRVVLKDIYGETIGKDSNEGVFPILSTIPQ
jgi:C1A family cysteine protease